MRGQGETMTLVREKAPDVYEWASRITTESSMQPEAIERHEEKREGVEPHDFYETPYFKMLTWTIKTTKRAFIGVMGLQGTGKSRILDQLGHVFPDDCFYFKWSADWLNRLLLLPESQKEYFAFLEGEAQAIFMELGHKGHQPKWMKKMNNVGELSTTLQERLVGPVKCGEMKREAARNVMDRKLLLLDMPDYNKFNPVSMSRDFDALGQFWTDTRSSEMNIVVALQKELVMKQPHLIIGKMDVMELEPLSVNDLVTAYKFITKDSELFTDDAIKLLGEHSRGIFRRFKQYIKLTIGMNLDETIPLKPEHVNKAITEKILFESMQLELSDIFKEKEKRLEAMEILSFLRTNTKVNVKSIAESLNLSEFVAQTMVRKLDQYLTISRGQGKELLISLR